MDISAKVELFLDSASFIMFNVKEKAFIILFENTAYKHFANVSNHKDWYEYFAGRKTRLVVVTDLFGTTVSLVDIDNLDTINLKEPKFVNGNIHQFFAAKLPEDTKFLFVIAGKNTENDMLIFPDESLYPKKLTIHGYSVIDKRLVK